MPRVARLLVGNTDRVPDLTYATGLFIPDDFAWFQTASGKTFALLGPLEIDRARRTGRVNQCLDLSAEEKRMGAGKHSYPRTLANVLRRHGVRCAEIPCTFPIGLAHSLTQAGLKLQSIPEPFFQKRIRKSPTEIRHILRAIRAAEHGLTRALEILKSSKIRRNKMLSWGGSILTSERLRVEMEITCLRHGALAKDTIVSCGNQACDPHERGSGPLRAHQSIILDIFPRHIATGYFGDITRTVLKGQAPEKLRHLRNTVVQGQKQVLQEIRAGAKGLRIQDGLREWFRDQGYPTQIQKGRWSGFFHGIGHGVGLEIHEAPRFSVPSLPRGAVITVEPGLYVPDIGGVRIEDVVAVQDGGFQRLTHFPDFWEIR